MLGLLGSGGCRESWSGHARSLSAVHLSALDDFTLARTEGEIAGTNRLPTDGRPCRDKSDDWLRPPARR